MFLFKRNNGVYYLYFTNETGRRKSVSTKAKYKPDALSFLANFKAIGKQRPKQIAVMRLSELRSEVLKYVADNMQRSTMSLYKTVFDNLERIFGNKPIKLINRSDIESYKATRANEVSRATANKELTIIKSLFNIAIRFDWLTDNPVRYISKLSLPEKEHLAFTRDETELILNNIDIKPMRQFIQFAFLTGCRLNEIVHLQWQDVNLNDSILTIRNKANFKTKTGKIRYIPISDRLNGLLAELIEQKLSTNVYNLFTIDDYIFANPKNNKYSKYYVSKYFKEVLRTLNFDEKFHFHCIRHTFITNLIKAGVNINYVKELAGHSEISTTMNYIHLKTNDLKLAIDKASLK